MAQRQKRTAERIKRQRKLRGQEPIEIAYRIGINVRTYERWEAGTVEPRLSNIKALADEWGLEIKDLRPDLEEETDQLARIESKLDRLLSQMVAAPPEDGELEDASADEFDDQADTTEARSRPA